MLNVKYARRKILSLKIYAGADTPMLIAMFSCYNNQQTAYLV